MEQRRNNDRRYNDNYRNTRGDNRNYNNQSSRQEHYDDYRRNLPSNRNNLIIISLLVIAGIASAFGAYKVFAGSSMAEITHVSPHFVIVDEPYNTCRNVQTTTYVANEKNGTKGAVIGGATGAVAGGVIGNQIRHGSGTVIGAVVGGVGGALIGDQVQKSSQPDYIAKHGTSKKCENKIRHVRTQQGFNVQYLYKDQIGKVITQNPPAVGSKVEVSQLQAMAIQN